MRILETTDRIAGGILAIGAFSGPAVGLFASRPAKRQPAAIRAFYGVVGVAAIYTLVRRVAPGTAKERRIEKISRWYDRAEDYSDQLDSYRNQAQKLWRQRERYRHQLKAHTAKLPKVYTPGKNS